MDFAADLLIFFSDFATPATLNGAPVSGKFDAAYAEVFGLVAGTRPTYLLPASVAVERGQSLVIGANDYTVVGIEPSRQGLTNRLILEAV